jgi:hypothetical protein
LAERRKHPRTRCELRVRWQRVHAERDATGPLTPSGPVETASARDFSRAGLAFSAAAPVEAGAVLQLTLERSFGGPPLSALGKVVRCDADGGEYVIGVELTWVECTTPEQALGLDPQNAWTLL